MYYLPQSKKRRVGFLIKHSRTYLPLLFIFTALTVVHAQHYNRGIGIYPGNPQEDFAPTTKIDSLHYRNIALYRPAYQSSGYDYNLTAQLITDGIIDTALPAWTEVATSSNGLLKRDGREHVLDRHASSQQVFDGANVWLQIGMKGSYDVPPVDSLSFAGAVTIDTLVAPQHWDIIVTGSNDGITWNQVSAVSGDSLPGVDGLTDMAKRFNIDLKKMPPEQMGFMRRFAQKNRRVLQYSFKLNQPVQYRYYRLNANNPGSKSWTISDLEMYSGGHGAPIGGPYHFSSAWKSAGNGEEWVYTDLGAICSFNHIKLHWVLPALTGAVQISNDAANWKEIAPLTGNTTDIALGHDIKARYVRILMKTPADTANGYILSELEVMGKGGPVPVAHAEAALEKNGKKNLAGGAWKLQRSTLVAGDGASISQPGFDDSKWLIATVPATTLVSYVNDGVLADPNFGDNQMTESDSYFYSDFWYRDVFTAPDSYSGHQAYLNFDGIDWQAEVYLNGHNLGDIKGAFIRGKFDVTGLLVPGGKNVLAVKVIKNETPGFPTEQNRNSTDANGGELGGDNPTFHASIGWDWIPTVRGRNNGIWNKVYLSQEGQVSLQDPFVSSKLPLPDTSSAEVGITVTLQNHSAKTARGVLRGTFGDIKFEQPVTLAASETKTVTVDPSTTPSLKINNPKIWWPNGYGQQNLYKVQLAFITADGKQSDEKSFQSGIRQMTYSEDGGVLKIWVNGKRFIARGGNWGFAEDLLRYRAREYDIAVRYHKEMNFNMIRNWVGQVPDEAFYQACDKYGIMIWQDFWLANPSDGPNPYHPDMFIKNMEDYVKRIRNHPSIGIFVGRNEGNPPPMIESALEKELPVLLPGIKYIPNSASGPVSGGGPYGLTPLKAYYQNNRALGKLHSEMGMPDVVSYESFKLMMPEADIWPQSTEWGLHDFTLQGAQNGGNFNKAIDKAFGKIDSAKQWISLAEWVGYQGYRAMFEAEAKNRMGLIIWMSHPSWPTLTWQSYDYYFEPTAAYFGGKKASEPLHIQWNPLSDSIEVINYSVPNGDRLTANMQVLNLDGTVKFSKHLALNSPIDSKEPVFPVTKPAGLDSVYFVKLELKRGDSLISKNLYMRGFYQDSTGGFGDLKAIAKLPKVKLAVDTKVAKTGDRWTLKTVLKNTSKYPAFNIRLKVIGAGDGERILPVIYDDNFITLMPGEETTITMELQNADTRGQKPAVVVEGFNLQ